MSDDHTCSPGVFRYIMKECGGRRHRICHVKFTSGKRSAHTNRFVSRKDSVFFESFFRAHVLRVYLSQFHPMLDDVIIPCLCCFLIFSYHCFSFTLKHIFNDTKKIFQREREQCHSCSHRNIVFHDFLDACFFRDIFERHWEQAYIAVLILHFLQCTYARIVQDACLIFELFHRSEEHTSELQSQFHLVCRLLLEKKQKHVLPSLPPITKIHLNRRCKTPACS